MDRKAQSIVARLRKHGLKVKCLGCRWRGRDRDLHGWTTGGRLRRIRDLKCPECHSAVVSLSWATSHPDRYREKVRLERNLSIFD